MDYKYASRTPFQRRPTSYFSNNKKYVAPVFSKKKEHFYTSDFYSSAGIDPFLYHIAQYFEGNRSVPVSKTGADHHKNNVYFTFSDNLMETFLENPDSMKKPYEAALKYGFRGHSSGGRNGIFYLRDGDRGLARRISILMEKNRGQILQDLDMTITDLDEFPYAYLDDVKIVWHNPSGERIVGIHNNENHRILFLGLASY